MADLFDAVSRFRERRRSPDEPSNLSRIA